MRTKNVEENGRKHNTQEFQVTESDATLKQTEGTMTLSQDGKCMW